MHFLVIIKRIEKLTEIIQKEYTANFIKEPVASLSILS